MVFEYLDLPERTNSEPQDFQEPLPAAIPEPAPASAPTVLTPVRRVAAPIRTATPAPMAPAGLPAPEPSRPAIPVSRGAVREMHGAITPIAVESGMCRVTRPKFVPAAVGVAMPLAPKVDPAKPKRTGWFFFGK